MERLSGSVTRRAVGFLVAKWAGLLVLALLLGASWPRETATRHAWENWMVFGALVALCTTLELAVFVTLVRPAALSGFALTLVGWLTATLVVFEVAFLGASLWPQHLSLALNGRLRVLVALLLLGCVPFVVALLRTGDADDLPSSGVMARRVVLWLALLAALGGIYWGLPRLMTR